MKITKVTGVYFSPTNTNMRSVISIACFRCIRECPMHAKNMNTPAYNEFAETFSRRLAEASPNEYFI